MVKLIMGRCGPPRASPAYLQRWIGSPAPPVDPFPAVALLTISTRYTAVGRPPSASWQFSYQPQVLGLLKCLTQTCHRPLGPPHSKETLLNFLLIILLNQMYNQNKVMLQLYLLYIFLIGVIFYQLFLLLQS